MSAAVERFVRTLWPGMQVFPQPDPLDDVLVESYDPWVYLHPISRAAMCWMAEWHADGTWVGGSVKLPALAGEDEVLAMQWSGLRCREIKLSPGYGPPGPLLGDIS